jgi:hypothetical protein
VFLDGIVMKRSGAGEVRNVSLLVASAATCEGSRAIPGICAGASEDRPGWPAFLRHLVDRGLKGVERIIAGACRGRVERAAEDLPATRRQRGVGYFHRTVFRHVPATKVRELCRMPKAIHARETGETAEAGAPAVVDARRRQRTGRAADLLDAHVGATLNSCSFPDGRWIERGTDSPLERIMRGIGRRTRVVGAFSDGQCCLDLAAARLRHIAGTRWSTRKSMHMTPLRAAQKEAYGAAFACAKARKSVDATKSVGARVEAWWKHEGENCCAILKIRAQATHPEPARSWRKPRNNARSCAIVHGSFGTTHNLKAAGSNPAPATRKLHSSITWRAAHRGGVCV